MCHTGWKSHWYKFHCKCGFQLTPPPPNKKNCSFVFVVSVTNGQLWSENIIWKIPEIAIHKCAILGSVMKSHAVLHHPTWDVNYPFPHISCLLASVTYSSWLSDWLSWHCSAWVQITLILLSNVPKAGEYWCWQFKYAKIRCRVLPLSEKVLDLMRKEKALMLRLLWYTVRTNLLLIKLWRKRKKFALVLLL